MKKTNQHFILISLSVLFSCTDVKKNEPKDVAKSDTELLAPGQTSTVKEPASDSSKTSKNSDTLSNVNYSFSNDTLCQTVNITEISKNKKLKIPEKLKFILLLHDKQHKFEDKKFEGVAQLSSSEESFSDNSDKDGGDYFAADYNCEAGDFKIQLRLDIQSYEACVVLVTSNQPDNVIGGYSAYLKKFPNDGVMKKGDCK